MISVIESMYKYSCNILYIVFLVFLLSGRIQHQWNQNVISEIQNKFSFLISIKKYSFLKYMFTCIILIDKNWYDLYFKIEVWNENFILEKNCYH